MKKSAFLFIVLIPFLAGCDLLKKATEIKISTELTSDVPVTVVSPTKKSLDLASAVTDLSFTQTQDLNLADNPDIEPYLSKIKAINLKGLIITVNGLTAGQSISSVTLDVAGVGTIFTQTGITPDNNSFTPVIGAGKLDQSAAKLMSDKKITLTISGTASGPMTFTVSCNFDTEVTASVL